MKTYTTHGTCARAIEYEVTDGILSACCFVGGCPGNTQGVAKLAVGRKVEDVISLLKGIQCRNGTSCPDQLARALEADLQSNAFLAAHDIEVVFCCFSESDAKIYETLLKGES